MAGTKEIFSFSFLIFAIALIMVSVSYIGRNDSRHAAYGRTASPIDETQGADPADLLSLANTSLDVIMMLSKGATIVDGPRLVEDADRDALPALYTGLNDPLFVMRINGPKNDLFVVMNSTAIIKTVPMRIF